MRACAAALLVLLLPALAFANGKYWPEPAYPKDPAIPLQRAMIVWDNGIETLIVESSFETDSPGVGWVLPVPAAPTKLAVAEPGMCRSLAMSVRPRVVHDLTRTRNKFLLAALLLVPVGLVLISQAHMRHRMQGLALLAVGYLGIALFFLPTLGRKEAAGVLDAVTMIRGDQRVGSYTVDVLQAKDADALDAWLKSEKLRGLDDAEREAVDDYIARKWCFVVARLHRDTKGAATPHPIAVSFPVEQPVYPMKLTALADSRTRVELFVVADDMATAGGFEVVVSDCYRPYLMTRAIISQPCWEGARTRLVIGSPDAGALLWENCVVTRLAADLSSGQMGQDVTLTLTMAPLRVRRQVVYSERGRSGIVQIVLLSGLILTVLAVTVLFYGRRKPSRWKFAALGFIAALTAAGAVETRLTIDAAPVHTERHWGPWREYGRLAGLQRTAATLLEEGKLTAAMTDDEFKVVPEMLGGDRPEHNPYTGEPMRMERTPGNFSVRRCDNTTFLCFYDIDGCEYRVDLKPPTGDQSSPTSSSSLQ